MPAETFYLNVDFVPGTRVCLTDQEHHHLSHVMRLRPGEEALLVNGRGSSARARIADIEKQLTTLEILSQTKTAPRPIQWIAAIPFLRPAKIEWVIEKGTELGADAFLLFRADHSEKDQFSEHQLERLRQITVVSLKQSGRLFLPSLEVLSHLDSVFQRKGQFLFGDIRPHAASIPERFEGPVIFISGPEKGFSEKEFQLLDQKGKGIRINPNTLRAETAPIAALSILGHMTQTILNKHLN